MYDVSWVRGVVSLSASESNSLSMCFTILNLSLCLLNWIEMFAIKRLIVIETAARPM